MPKYNIIRTMAKDEKKTLHILKCDVLCVFISFHFIFFISFVLFYLLHSICFILFASFCLLHSICFILFASFYLLHSICFILFALSQGSTFKNALNMRRKEKTILENIITNEKSNEQERNCAQLLNHKLNKDIRTIEKNTYDVIKLKCIPKATDQKILMFYWHLLGDITRYCSDTFDAEQKKKMQERSMRSYSYALGYANRMNIPPSSPRMLELLVSLTVLYKDIETDINISIEMAAQAFRDAIQNMHLLENDDECSKTIRILGVLRDNINKWCKLSGRKNVNALFEIKGENFDKYKDIMNSIQS